jgi:hypothetical protein
MKKIPSNNSLFSINNLSSSSKIYMTAFVNKINDEFLEDSPYNIINFVKDNLSPSSEELEKEKIIHSHSSHIINYNEHAITYDMPIYFISILIFVFYYFIQHREIYSLSNNKTVQHSTENNHNTNIINYILLALFIIFSRNIENAI